MTENKRRELWDRWVKLEHDISQLKTIIQNPMELSIEDKLNWSVNSLESQSNLRELCQETHYESIAGKDTQLLVSSYVSAYID